MVDEPNFQALLHTLNTREAAARKVASSTTTLVACNNRSLALELELYDYPAYSQLVGGNRKFDPATIWSTS